MEIEGRVIMDLGVQSGTSKAGNPWKKREMVLETFGSYPKKVKFTIFGEQRVDTMNIVPGKDYILSVDLESREFNGRWYTDVNCFAVRDYVGGNAPAPSPGFSQATSVGQPQGFQTSANPSFTSSPADNDEDLPF